MNRLIETLFNDRLVGFLDTFLLCLGLTMTVAAVAPMLESAAARVRRSPARLRAWEGRR
ncbi:MAG: hypothetical protein HY728_10515 [Candidatus Rokubacteria bacterium]|nr:hypothetical protein [Candidatus Rokubacteria bacterium]